METKSSPFQLSFLPSLTILHFLFILMLKLQPRECFLIRLMNCHVPDQRRQSFRMLFRFFNWWKSIWFLTVLAAVSSATLEKMKLWLGLYFVTQCWNFEESYSILFICWSVSFIVHQGWLLFASTFLLFYRVVERFIWYVFDWFLLDSFQH